MAYAGMAYAVMADVAMFNIATVYIVMAYIVMADGRVGSRLDLAAARALRCLRRRSACAALGRSACARAGAITTYRHRRRHRRPARARAGAAQRRAITA